MSTSEPLAVYEKYLTTLRGLPSCGQTMPYDWSALPKDIDGKWLVYRLTLFEFSREIANTINTLSSYTKRIKAWSIVIDGLSQEDKLRVVAEFIDPVAIVAVGLPYVIRSRFVFAAAHLCHQANQAKPEVAWEDDLALDQEIYMDHAQAKGARWRKFGRLKLQMEKIGGRSFKQATHDFRHAYNHRFSPHFVVGFSQIVRRVVDPETKKATSYVIGGIEPINLNELSSILRKECDYCYLAFDAFQKLVAEHENLIVELS